MDLITAIIGTAPARGAKTAERPADPRLPEPTLTGRAPTASLLPVDQDILFAQAPRAGAQLRPSSAPDVAGISDGPDVVSGDRGTSFAETLRALNATAPAIESPVSGDPVMPSGSVASRQDVARARPDDAARARTHASEPEISVIPAPSPAASMPEVPSRSSSASVSVTDAERSGARSPHPAVAMRTEPTGGRDRAGPDGGQQNALRESTMARARSPLPAAAARPPPTPQAAAAAGTARVERPMPAAETIPLARPATVPLSLPESPAIAPMPRVSANAAGPAHALVSGEPESLAPPIGRDPVPVPPATPAREPLPARGATSMMAEAPVLTAETAPRLAPLSGERHAPSPQSWSAPLPGEPSAARVVLSAGPDGRFALQLQPGDLGRIDLAFEPGEDGLRLVVSAERVQTVETIRRHDAVLLSLLRDAGFSALSLDIRQGGAQDGNPFGQAPRYSLGKTEEVDLLPVAMAAAGSAPPAHPSSTALDLRL